MAIDKRYVDAIEALSTTYFDKLGTSESFNEQQFMQNMRKRVQDQRDLSPNMKKVIDNLVSKHVEGKQRSTTKGQGGAPVADLTPIERGRFSAYKAEGGWQLYIDKIKVGVPVDRNSAGTIIYWLEDAMADLAIVCANEGQVSPAQDALSDEENLPAGEGEGTSGTPF
jgi:hypothetical protein